MDGIEDMKASTISNGNSEFETNDKNISSILEKEGILLGKSRLENGENDNTHLSKNSLDSCVLSDPLEGYVNKDQYQENISIREYIIIKELGSGSSAKVVLAFHKITDRRVAIKIVKRNGVDYKELESFKDKKKSSDNSGFNDIRIFREVVMSSLIDSPFIVKLLDFLYSDTHFFLIFEYVKGKQLYDVILKNSKISEERARKYFRQLLSAIEYLHKNCIVHRDLKIENIVIDQNDNLKLIDFGLANFYDNSNLLQTFCGSLYFAAPELLMGMQYNGPEVDIWSLGIVLYVMLCGKVPFDDECVKDLQMKIKEANLTFNTTISNDAKDLLSNLIVSDVAKRYTLNQILQSKWINKGYNGHVESFISKRFPIMKLNKEYVTALSVVLSFQFPNAKEQLKSFYACCDKKQQKFDSIYWLKNPIISMYYLLAENIGSYSNADAKALKFSIPLNFCEKNNIPEFSEEEPKYFLESLHRFVKFVFANDSRNVSQKYFVKSAFKDNDESTSESLHNDIIKNPPIKNSFFKGLFYGIKVKHIGSQNALKKIILDIFEKNSVSYEAEEKGYFCSYNYDENECYFKVSLYYNVIFSEYYLVLKCLNSKKESFRVINKIVQNSLKYRS